MLFFTADWHLSHKRILSYCGRTEFMSDKEKICYEQAKNHNELRNLEYSEDAICVMNDTIIDSCNQYVKKDDILFFLGDFAFGRNVDDLCNFKDRIKCDNIYFILGNHDQYSLLQPLFFPLIKTLEFKYQGHYLFCTHNPQEQNSLPRYTINLHGHCHGNLEYNPNILRLDVGIDYRNKLGYGYTPWSFSEILDFLGLTSPKSPV